MIRYSHDSAIARRQDALGSMLWRALQPTVDAAHPNSGAAADWNLRPEDAGAIMTTLATAIRSGLAVPRPLPALIGEAAAAAPVTGTAQPDGHRWTWPVQRRHHRPHHGGRWAGCEGLTNAMNDDPRTGLTGAEYTAPLREDMLRALSQSVPPDSRNGQAQQRLRAAGATINDMFRAVTIVNPAASTGLPPSTARFRSRCATAWRSRLRYACRSTSHPA